MTGIRRLEPGSEIDPHRHDDHQLAYPGRGVVAVSTEAGSWLAPGTRAIWVPAGVVHEHRAYGRVDLHFVGVPAADDPLGAASPVVLGVDPLLRELLRAYTAATADDDPETAIGVAEHLRMRTVLFDRLRRAPRHGLFLPAPRDPRLIAACAPLYADPSDPRTLAELGAASGASERTLARLFRRETAMTFPQWRTQIRLQHALVLLAEDGSSVTETAYRCGWSTPSAFIDAFRRVFGHTPGAARTR